MVELISSIFRYPSFTSPLKVGNTIFWETLEAWGGHGQTEKFISCSSSGLIRYILATGNDFSLSLWRWFSVGKLLELFQTHFTPSSLKQVLLFCVFADGDLMVVCQKFTAVKNVKCSTGIFKIVLKRRSLSSLPLFWSLVEFCLIIFWSVWFGWFCWFGLGLDLVWTWFGLGHLITSLKYPQCLLLAHCRVLSHLFTGNS